MPLSIGADLGGMYDVFAEAITIGATAGSGISSDGFAEVLGVNSTEPSLRVVAGDFPSLAVGQLVAFTDTTSVHYGVAYRVADLRPISPDKLETRVILELV